MLVGPTGGGKTACLNTLEDAMSRLDKIPGFAKVNHERERMCWLSRFFSFSPRYKSTQ
jgi:septin family protein